MFSLMPESELSDEAYLTTFFDTGSERQHHAQQPRTAGRDVPVPFAAGL